MRKDDFTLHFSMPLDDLDWHNLTTSRVSRVMLPLEFCDTATLDRLRSMGIRLVARIAEGSYSAPDAPRLLMLKLQACVAHVGSVVAIIGCEPEAAFDFRYGAATWGQKQAYQHRDALWRTCEALRAAGIVCVSPGWLMRSISEDEPPAPGVATWTEICRLEYDGCMGNGGHIYQYGWDGPVDILRFKFALKDLLTRWHNPIWLDEVGIAGSAPAAEKMRAYMDMADELIATPAIGGRVMMLCPFVSNGNPGIPPAWDARYIMRDPACYAELGKWMVS